MVSADAAARSLKEGDVAAALKQLQEQIRAAPGDAKLRIFLFQLLALTGRWERSLDQLNLAAKLDPAALAMAQMYREALQCERLRADVFAGRRSPMVLGEPPQWLALLIESILTASRGQAAQSERLRQQAFEQAPATAGSIDGKPFDWIADADSRLGPVLEAVINGRYYWIPFDRLQSLDLEQPSDLRDLVWAPAHFAFTNGGESVGVVPTRYPGSETSEDGSICLARKTEWQEVSPGVFHGLGQRLFATDAGEFPILDVRTILLSTAGNGTSASERAGG